MQTNCLTVTMFDDAMKRAKEVDEYFAATGKTLGPLPGLPMSLKDCFNVRGYPSSVGLTAWASDAMPTDSTIVSLLRSTGAVLYVKTNVPTAMIFTETVNYYYGRATPKRYSCVRGSSWRTAARLCATSCKKVASRGDRS